MSPIAYEDLYKLGHSVHDWGPAWDEVIGIPRVDAGGVIDEDGDEDGTPPDEQVFPSISAVYDGFQPWSEDVFGISTNCSSNQPSSQSTDMTEHSGADYDICFGMVS